MAPPPVPKKPEEGDEEEEKVVKTTTVEESSESEADAEGTKSQATKKTTVKEEKVPLSQGGREKPRRPSTSDEGKNAKLAEKKSAASGSKFGSESFKTLASDAKEKQSAKQDTQDKSKPAEDANDRKKAEGQEKEKLRAKVKAKAEAEAKAKENIKRKRGQRQKCLQRLQQSHLQSDKKSQRGFRLIPSCERQTFA